jgi:hypothetical protein
MLFAFQNLLDEAAERRHKIVSPFKVGTSRRIGHARRGRLLGPLNINDRPSLFATSLIAIYRLTLTASKGLLGSLESASNFSSPAPP